jgi:carboxymethylenebutenolidase
VVARTGNTVQVEEIICAGGMPAYLARPAADGKAPCIVLMHERYGLVQHTKDLARRFAEAGYVCIAPDVFFRHPDQEGLRAGTVICSISDPDAVRDLSAAIDALDGVTSADTSRIAVKGVCQTGRHPLVLAAERRIAAALVWYGAAQKNQWPESKLQPRPLEEIIAAIDCPVFGAFGETDHLISLDDVRRLRNCLEDKKKTYEIHVFGAAPHGWLNDTMPGRYRREPAEASWAAQLKFLAGVFGATGKPSTVSWKFVCDSSASYDFSKNVRLE